MPHEGIAHTLTEQNAAAHHHARDRPVWSHPQQHAHLGDVSGGVHTHRHRVDVHDGKPRPRYLQIAIGKPLLVGVGGDLGAAHTVIVPDRRCEGVTCGWKNAPMDLGDHRTDTVGSPFLLVPVGSCEQHGPHLPLATDTLIATAICDAMAIRHTECVVAPAIAIAASGEHAGFAGTLSIGVEVLTHALVELGRSADWAHGLVFVNGHGGNTYAVTTAARTLVTEGRRASAWSPTGDGYDLHAGHDETSVMLHLHPNLVGDHTAITPVHVQLSDVVRDGVAAHSPSGVLGDPRTASANAGAAIIADWVAQLAQHVERVLT